MSDEQPTIPAGPGEQDTPPTKARGIPAELSTALAEVEALRARVKKERKKRKKAERKGSDGSLGSRRGIETMFRTSYRTHNDLTQLADNKANIMISINGIIISILLASITPRIDLNPWLLAPMAVLLVACVISLVYAILAARPRVTRAEVSVEDLRGDQANILFFGNFVQLDEAEFVAGMRELMTHTDRLYLNMVRDLYALGRVLSTKFRLLRTSYTVFMAGLVAGVGLFLVVLIATVASGTSTVVIP